MRYALSQLTRQADLLALGLALVIAVLSLLPVEQLPEVAVSDKLEHLVAYGMLGLLATLRRHSLRALSITLLLIIGYGAAIEYLQPYVGRFMELGDFIANSSGAFLGALIARWIRYHSVATSSQEISS